MILCPRVYNGVFYIGYILIQDVTQNIMQKNVQIFWYEYTFCVILSVKPDSNVLEAMPQM